MDLRPPLRQNSGSHTPRIRPHATTLNIPGMTRSRVSPDGKIANRDVAAKLVIIMVGLPARGKSYITKKLQRYLAWQQHNSRIFNVGNRRRLAAGILSPPAEPAKKDISIADAASMLLNGTAAPAVVVQEPLSWDLNGKSQPIEQSAVFFDPHNEVASRLREQVALDTLDEILDYLLNQNGAVGILDATNSTIHRRQLLIDRVRQREPKLGVLFIESICQDQNVSHQTSHQTPWMTKCRTNALSV
jgi:6-phosphofructo-2-kinase